MIHELERTVEERYSAKCRAQDYIEDHRMTRREMAVRGLIYVVAFLCLGLGLGQFALWIIERDNNNFWKEKGQQPVFETEAPMIEHDRTIKTYEYMKSRYGLE